MTVHFNVKLPGDYITGAAVPFQFPGGEWHLRNIADVRDPQAVWIADVRGANPDELIQAALFADVAHQRQNPFVLWAPYFPAARADRAFLNEQPVGVGVYASLIKAMNPQQVVCIDPHSTAVLRYLPTITALSPVPLLKRALGYTDDPKEPQLPHHYDAVIAPDKGAIPRANDAAIQLDGCRITRGTGALDVYHAVKDRDEATGKILGIRMEENLPPSGKYLLVDDICDGGGTFMGLADATGLPKEQLGLWITHSIFSGNATQLRSKFARIYTTDSHPGYNRMGCATSTVPCEPYLLQNLNFGDGQSHHDTHSQLAVTEPTHPRMKGH